MNVSACIATRGDIDMAPILDSLPHEWEKIVWVNGTAVGKAVWDERNDWSIKDAWTGIPDLGPHGRFAAIQYASHDLIYVQDDDVIVSDPQAIVDEWLRLEAFPEDHPGHPHGCHVVCNMPPEFRPHYPDSAMVGFGAAFHRDAPQRAFDRYAKHFGQTDIVRAHPSFTRESCRIFTVLTPRMLVDVPKTDMPYASDPNRLWKQPDHIQSRERMLALAREVRDARS